MERLNFKECNNCKDWNGGLANCLNICGKPLDALKEFNELKKLEEQGKLLKLPCATGSFLYKPTARGIISEYIVREISNHGGRIFINWQLNSGIYTSNGIYADEIGKSVFLTREAAVEAMGKENNKV